MPNKVSIIKVMLLNSSFTIKLPIIFCNRWDEYSIATLIVLLINHHQK